MGLQEITAEFVKCFNDYISKLDPTDERNKKNLELLISKLEDIKAKTISAEQNVYDFFKLYRNKQIDAKDCYFIRKDGNIRAIVSKNIQKLQVSEVSKISCSCECEIIKFPPALGIQQYITIENEEELNKLDESLNSIFLSVFDHNYRSYNGLTCYICIAKNDGIIFIIDAIKFRALIPNLKMLKCGVQKLIHCEDCVGRLINDFGDIGCYVNYSKISAQDIYVDWRIRPLNNAFITIMTEEMQGIIEKSNKEIYFERFVPKEKDKTEAFIEKYSLLINTSFLSDILELREYLARHYNEGIQYVLTDHQIMQLLDYTPTTVEEFERLLIRMSTILRQHVNDFLLILIKKNKQNLQNKRLCNDLEDFNQNYSENNEKYKNFDKIKNSKPKL